MHAIDYLVVGAGLSAAAFCAEARRRRTQARVVVLDCRQHVGGNCYDALSCGTYVHQYGPHVWHCPQAEITEWVLQYTRLRPYVHRVQAEVQLSDGLRQVPFPYSRDTLAALGRSDLDLGDVLQLFYTDYTHKMWGQSWGSLPDDVRQRVPTEPKETSSWFDGQGVGLPADGYTAMISRMFDGCDLLLGVAPDAWYALHAQADVTVYCGRVDLLRQEPESALTMRALPFDGVDPERPRESPTCELAYVDLAFEQALTDVAVPAVTNFCHSRTPFTRRTYYRAVTGGASRAVTFERPVLDARQVVSPAYPHQRATSAQKYTQIMRRALRQYRNFHVLGRLGQFRYIDMWQAVAGGLKLARELS